MLECNTGIAYLGGPVNLVFKLHFSTYKDLANIVRTLPGPGEFSERALPLRIMCPSQNNFLDPPLRWTLTEDTDR